MKNSGFTLHEVALTNEIVKTTYIPSSTVTSYTYTIYKDGQIKETKTIPKNRKTNFVFEESGTYSITIFEKDKFDMTTEVKSGTYKLDVTAPKIVVTKDYLETVTLTDNQSFSISKYKDEIRVIDIEEGDLFSNLTCEVKGDLTKVGPTKLYCEVKDSAGNTSEKEIILNVVKNHQMELNSLFGIFILFVFLFILYFIRFSKSNRIEKKLATFGVESIKEKKESLLEKGMHILYLCMNKIVTILKKSVFFTKYAKKYDKYVVLYPKELKEGMDLVGVKFVIGILLVIISILSSIIRYKLIIAYELVIPFVIGFFIPDIIFFVNYKIYKRKLENDLLQAIIIMNNAFKSGRSIQQAICLVMNELDGPIGIEFKKMHMELSFGLSIEEVFKRLSDRIQIEEVTYLTASLSILNKTGGNIIKVFSSIEKTLFNKKRLKLELNSLTGSSKIIVYVLFLVPFFFILFISLIQPNYFEPFYTTPVGLIFMGIIAFIYLIYVFVVTKVMKVRM